MDAFSSTMMIPSTAVSSKLDNRASASIETEGCRLIANLPGGQLRLDRYKVPNLGIMCRHPRNGSNLSFQLSIASAYGYSNAADINCLQTVSLFLGGSTYSATAEGRFDDPEHING